MGQSAHSAVTWMTMHDQYAGGQGWSSERPQVMQVKKQLNALETEQRQIKVIGQCIWLLNISKDGDSTGLWENSLCHCSNTFTVQKWFLMLIQSCQLKPSASGPVTGHYWLHPLCTPLSSITILNKIFLNPLFFRLNLKHSQPVLVQWMYHSFQSLNPSGFGIFSCPNTRTTALLYRRKYSGGPQILMRLNTSQTMRSNLKKWICLVVREFWCL